MALMWLMHRARLRLLRGQPGADDLVAQAVGYLARPYLAPQQRLPLRELRVTAALVADDPADAVARAASALGDPALTTEPRYAWPLLTVAARSASIAAESAVPAAAVGALREWGSGGLAGSVPARYSAPRELAHAAQVWAELRAVHRLTTLHWQEGEWRPWRMDGQPLPAGRVWQRDRLGRGGRRRGGAWTRRARRSSRRALNRR
jgi:hypothetical protein